ncbi:MAG: ATP-binding protein [Eubacteriales bacterium]
MTAAGYIRAVENHCKTLHPQKEGDYKKDGLLYCGKCDTPLECVIQIPITGEIHAVPIACACRAAEHERYRAELARKATEENRRQALPLEKYRKMTFEASDIPLPFAKKYVERWDEMLRQNIGLLLSGSVGTGKTYIAAAIANALVDRGEWVYMHNIASMTSALRDTYKGGHADIMSRAAMSRLFVIDDFGAECMTPYSLQITYELIDIIMQNLIQFNDCRRLLSFGG